MRVSLVEGPLWMDRPWRASSGVKRGNAALGLARSSPRRWFSAMERSARVEGSARPVAVAVGVLLSRRRLALSHMLFIVVLLPILSFLPSLTLLLPQLLTRDNRGNRDGREALDDRVDVQLWRLTTRDLET